MNSQRAPNAASVLTVIAAIIAAAAVSFATTTYLSGNTLLPGTPHSVSTIEKVLETGVIRCGYVAYPPGLIKDPNTGQVSGIFAEVLETAAKNLGLKVLWAEEVGWGTMVEGLKASRYDMICSPVWPLAQRVRVADFSQPIYYGGAEAYVRADDTRFDATLTVLNNDRYRIATTDGEVTDTIAQQDFPKAQRLSMPQLTDISQLLLSVADGKADVTFVEPHVAYVFLKNNPGKLKSVHPGKPLRLYANTMMLKQEDTLFRRLIDNAMNELQNNGLVDRTLLKYEPFPGAFYRRAIPIQVAPAH